MSASDDPTVPGAPLRGPAAAAGFTPGQVLAARYRMVGLLGRGGMGVREASPAGTPRRA